MIKVSKYKLEINSNIVELATAFIEESLNNSSDDFNPVSMGIKLADIELWNSIQKIINDLKDKKVSTEDIKNTVTKELLG